MGVKVDMGVIVDMCVNVAMGDRLTHIVESPLHLKNSSIKF